MGEELKLFGEVGLGYSQLQKDAEHINKLLNDIDKNAKLLGDSFSKNKLDPNTAKTIKELEKMYEKVIKSSEGNKIAEKSTKDLTKAVDELNKKIAQNKNNMAEAVKSLSSVNFNTKDFEKQTKDISKFIDVQRSELTKWAKEKTSLAKELSLRDISQMVNDNYRSVNKSGNATEKAEAIRRVGQAMSVLNYTMEQNKAKVKDLTVEYEKMQKVASSLTGEAKKVANSQASAVKKQITEISRETGKLETQAKRFDKILNFTGADQSAKSTTKSMGMLLGQAYAIKRAFEYINKEVKDFERNSVEIQRIAGYTKQEMDNLAKATFDMGHNMGLNVNTIQEIEGLWARAGKGGKDLVEATKTTALGFNVAEFKDAESAVASINSIINQMYNGDATKAPEILDALTKVADKTAVRNVNDLVEVVSRAGANAKSLGMNLHELNAASSVVMERMKTTGDILGTQFKTIFAYMADSKRIGKLKKYGVEFTNISKDGTESLKPFLEMMDNLVNKYNELKKQGKDVMANDMIRELSGVRNVATLKNLVEGWGSMRERILLSKNSKGFAERQNAKMMETYAKKVEQLKVAFQELAVSVGNNGLLDGLKLFADSMTSGVEFVSKYNKQILTLIGTVIAFKTTMKGIEGVIKIFGNNGLMGMFKLMTDSNRSKGFRTKFALSTLSGTEFLMKKEMQQKAWEGVAKGASGAVSPINTLAGAMSGLKAKVIAMTTGMSMAVPVIGAVTLALGALFVKMYVDKQKRLKILDDFTSGKADEAIGNIRELKKELDGITDTQAFQKGDKTALDAYKSTTEELSRTLGMTNSVIVGNKESMETYNKSLKLAVELKEKEYELNKQIASSEAKTAIEDMAKTVTYANGYISDSKMGKVVRDYVDNLNRVKKIQNEIDNGNNSSRMLKKLDSATTNSVQAELELTQKIQELKKYQAQAGMSDEEINKLFSGYLDNGTSIIDVMNEVIAKSGDTKEGLEQVGEGAKGAKEETDELKESIDQLLDQFDKLTNQTDVIEKAFKDIYDNGFIDNGTVMKLLQVDPEMVNYITKTKDGYTLLAGAVEHYKEIQADTNQTVEEAINKERQRQDMATDINGNPFANSVQSEELKQSLNEMTSAIKDSIDTNKITLKNGQTDVKDFFKKIKEAKDDADLSNLLSDIDTSQLQKLNGVIANDLQTNLAKLGEKFGAGIINIGDYAKSVNDAQENALDLYTKINGLTKNNDGVWLTQAGQVDEFANALQKSVSKINDTKDTYIGLINAIKKTPAMALAFTDQNFDIPREQIVQFSGDFAEIMRQTKEHNSVIWNGIVKEMMAKTGKTKEQIEKMLTDNKTFIQTQDKDVKTALVVSFAHLGEQLNLTEAQIRTSARNIGAMLADLASSALSKMSTINSYANSMSSQSTSNLEDKLPSSPITDMLSVRKAINAPINGGKKKVATKSGRLIDVDTVTTFDLQQNINKYAADNKKIEKQEQEAEKLSNERKKSTQKTAQALGKNATPLQSIIPEDRKTHPSSGKGSKSNPDIPTVVEDRLEDLRHELEMGRISEEQFYKGVEKLYKSNTGSLTKRGKQKFEKMIKDAKTKADSSMPPYVKVLVDDLEEQLKYDEIDQYTYASKLDDIAQKYKAQLGQKAVKEIEKKISEAKVGGLDKYFKSQIDEFEDIIKVSDLAIKKIQAEQSLYEALNMGDTAGMGLQANKINVINNKLYATEALAKKYESVLKAINEEIKKLDKNSSFYKTTLDGLTSKQGEFTNKLNETRISIVDLQKARIEEQMKIYDAMQKKYDDYVSNMEQMESHLITFIQQRNQKIREQIDKNHKARMDDLDKETKARDKELEKEKKRLQDALEAYRKYTQGKIDSLDKNWEEEDYQKELDKKLKDRDEIQQRITSLSLDDTSTARGKRIELTKQLADKDNEIEEFQRERSRKLTKEGLQKQLKDYEDSIENKQKKLDEQTKKEQEDRDNRRKALEDEYRHELDILDEKMKASNMYAEAKQAILSGYVTNAVGASITIKQAMIQGMREQGKASGILAETYIRNLDAMIRKAHEAKQAMGMASSSAGAGSLQARLGLTDAGYQQYLGEKADYLGFSKTDVEKYINNKLAYQNASASERKRLQMENHKLRAKYAGNPKNWNDKRHNRDINGAYLGQSWIYDTGSAMKVGKSFGQTTPLGGGFSREEARDYAMADLGLYNPYSRGSSEAFFDNQRNTYSALGMTYSQPNLGSWTTPNYYKQWKDQSNTLDRFDKTPSDMSDYMGALGYIQNYKNELQKSDQYNSTPPDSVDNNVREALMSAAKAQDGMPYSQSSKRYTTHRDCSSYVYYAVKNAGLYGGDGFYTGDMIPKLAQYGWKDLGHIPQEQIKRGDIFWIRDGKHNHTEIATQDGTLNSTGAHSPKKPAGPSVWGYNYKILRHPKVNGYSQGGIADYTGMAMLHGSKSSPEYIFNAPQFDALGRMIANYISIPTVYGKGVYNGSATSLPEINIETLIKIEGNADKNTIREIERTSDDILDKLVIGLKKRGIRK